MEAEEGRNSKSKLDDLMGIPHNIIRPSYPVASSEATNTIQTEAYKFKNMALVLPASIF